LLQKLAFDEGRGFENGPIMYRIAYYMIGHKPRMKGKWAYGQFAAMMTGAELKVIVKEMEEKGWMDSGDHGSASNAEVVGPDELRSPAVADLVLVGSR
jgi:hypothetical protein